MPTKSVVVGSAVGLHARLNLATSPERLTEIVRRLASAWT